MTQQDKEQYFASNYGNPVQISVVGRSPVDLRVDASVIRDVHNQKFEMNLQLRSKESLTDEEQEIYINLIPNEWHCHDGLDMKFEEMTYPMIDYLRSISVATPWRQYSVEQLIENKVLQIK